MSLAVVFKGADGIVLAADSRVTLPGMTKQGRQTLIYASTFDNTTKLFSVKNSPHVGVVTWGLGGIGEQEPRTVYSLMPEFEDRLDGYVPVENVAQELSGYFMDRWKKGMPDDYKGDNIHFLVGGIDKDEVYGKVFEFSIPDSITPTSRFDRDNFGIIRGGQTAIMSRIFSGIDPQMPDLLSKLGIEPKSRARRLADELHKALSLPIPYQFLPLQDCVDLCIFGIQATMTIQRWSTQPSRGVGGAIDIATITRTNGFEYIQSKKIEARSLLSKEGIDV